MFERAPGFGVDDGQAVEEDKEETRRWTRRTLRCAMRGKLDKEVVGEMDRGRQGDF